MHFFFGPIDALVTARILGSMYLAHSAYFVTIDAP